MPCLPTHEALERLNAAPYPIVISDIYLDERTGIDVLHAARSTNPNCAVILMTARGTIETVMASTRGGAFDYIAKPFELDHMLDTVKRAEASVLTNENDADTDVDDLPVSEMIGSSAEMIEIYKTISRVAPTDATVLVEGETGTGKEMIARMVHNNSARATQPFVPVDCAIDRPSPARKRIVRRPSRSVHRRGPRPHGPVRIGQRRHGLSGRDRRYRAELPAQAASLPAGARDSAAGRGARPQVDVRVVAATNRDLQQMVDEGQFREDLWFRLNVVRIMIPPLRDRAGDVRLAGALLPSALQRPLRTERAVDSVWLEGDGGLFPGPATSANFST